MKSGFFGGLSLISGNKSAVSNALIIKILFINLSMKD